MIDKEIYNLIHTFILIRKYTCEGEWLNECINIVPVLKQLNILILEDCADISEVSPPHPPTYFSL